MRIESNIYPRQVVSVSVQNKPVVDPVETTSIGNNPLSLPVIVSRRKSTPVPVIAAEVIETDTVIHPAQSEVPEEPGAYHPSREIRQGYEDAFVDFTEILNPGEQEEAKRAAALGVRKKIVEDNYHPDLSPKSLNLSIYA